MFKIHKPTSIEGIVMNTPKHYTNNKFTFCETKEQELDKISSS